MLQASYLHILATLQIQRPARCSHIHAQHQFRQRRYGRPPRRLGVTHFAWQSVKTQTLLGLQRPLLTYVIFTICFSVNSEEQQLHLRRVKRYIVGQVILAFLLLYSYYLALFALTLTLNINFGNDAMGAYLGVFGVTVVIGGAVVANNMFKTHIAERQCVRRGAPLLCSRICTSAE